MRRWWWLLPALIVATLAAYQPAWHGGPLWDDDGHITSPELRDVRGLGRIWFQVGATQQYYPVVHSAFWVLHRTAGDTTLPYHLLNIVLHALSAFLLAIILKRLAVSSGAAVLAAAIFALHPVHVESVAWITELKNTLSGALYLASALVYLRFDRERRPRDYAIALALFVVALLSKTVTATLPAGLLVIFWWQRGRIDLRRDARPLVPFFVLGAASGLLTAWVERTFIGAQGAAYQIAFLDRFVIAGRATWFYLAKLVWPANLIFIYPRWEVGTGAWWLYLYPLTLAIVIGILWQLRHRSRAPLAALAFFAVTAAPALGFVNVYPFRFSFVADHFQYLASIGIIALASAGAVELLRHRGVPTTAAAAVLVPVLAGPFAVLTWRHSRDYVDAETLYRATIARNPACWLAYNNLGALKLLGSPDDRREGMDLIQKSLAINPDNAEAHNNLGYVFSEMDRIDDALREHETAIRLSPGFADAHNSRGADLYKLGRHEEAERELREAIRLKPNLASAYDNLGMVLMALNRPDEAMAASDRSFQLNPDSAAAHFNLGNALLKLNRLNEALAEFQLAVRLKPGYGEASHNAGQVLERLGRWPEAVSAYQSAVRLMPGSGRSQNGLGRALLRMDRPAEAAPHLEAAVRLQPEDSTAHFDFANALLDLGRPGEAVGEFHETLKREPPPGAAETHNNLGIALAQLGRLSEAVVEFREALRIRPDYQDARQNLQRATRK